ncbi:hypothetical protein, partial [Micrococcus luteus]|uniref:hypothetical protein n=1 Tax=Micrococcus luteus TaxID=1270 RepID=UPI001C92BD37
VAVMNSSFIGLRMEDGEEGGAEEGDGEGVAGHDAALVQQGVGEEEGVAEGGAEEEVGGGGGVGDEVGGEGVVV